MKNFSVRVVIGVLLLGCGISGGQANDDDYLGTLGLMYGGSTVNDCALNLKEGYHSYRMRDLNCKNDQVYYFNLTNVPAGMMIVFCGGSVCNTRTDNNFAHWRYWIRVIKNSGSMGAFALSNFKEMAEGTVSDGTIKLVEGVDDGQVHGKLSHIRTCFYKKPPGPEETACINLNNDPGEDPEPKP